MRPLLAVAGLMMLALPVWAQDTGATGTGNPAGMSAGTPRAAPGTPAANQPNDHDRLFVREATLGGMAEVEMGRLAGQKAQADVVKRFAQRMVEDHSKANNRLAQLAKDAHIEQPGRLDREHAETLGKLQKLSGEAFDRAYIQAQIEDHQQTAQLFEYQIAAGQDAQLNTFATEVLPIVLDHLAMAQAIAGKSFGELAEVPGARGQGRQ